MEEGGGDRGGRGRRPWRKGEETVKEGGETTERGGGDNGGRGEDREGRRVFNAMHIKTTD